MSSNAFWVFGSLLQLGDGGSPTEIFATIAEVRDITPPSMERDVIDVSSHDSTGGWKEFISGWRDGGEVEFEVNWLPTNATHNETTGFMKTFYTNTVHNWKLVLQNNLAVVTWSGFLTKPEPDLQIEEQAQMKVTMKVSWQVLIDSTP